MGDLLSFLQLVVALVALYFTLYSHMKKKYQNFSALQDLRRKRKLPYKQYIKEEDKIEQSVGLLNTIYIIITLTAITVYFSPFKGFLQFFKGKYFDTLQGKIIYIVSSSISFLVLTYYIGKYIFKGDLLFLDGIYQYLFYAFLYIFCIAAMLKVNQLALAHSMKLHEDSLSYMLVIICFIDSITDGIILIVYMSFAFGYNCFIDFLCEKFADEI